MVERGHKKPTSSPSTKFSPGRSKDKTPRSDKLKASDDKFPPKRRFNRPKRRSGDKKAYTLEFDSLSGKYQLEPKEEYDDVSSHESLEEEELVENTIEKAEDHIDTLDYYDTVYPEGDGIHTIDGYNIDNEPVEYVMSKEIETCIIDLDQVNAVDTPQEHESNNSYDNKELGILEELNNLYFKACNAISNLETKKGAYQKQYNKKYIP